MIASNRDACDSWCKLYDKRNHTYKFSAPVSAMVTWMFDFEDLPEAFTSYITLRASNLFAARAVGSTEVVKYSEREEAAARAAMMEYECSQGDYNIFGDNRGKNIMRGFQPLTLSIGTNYGRSLSSNS